MAESREMRWTMAAVQMNSTEDRAANLAAAERLLAEAVAKGSQIVLLPELFNAYGRPDVILGMAEEPEGLTFRAMQDWSRRFDFELLAGTWLVRGADPDRAANRLVLFGRGGQVLAEYVKMHLFEIDTAGSHLCEAQYQVAGDQVVAIDTPVGRVGLSICYDLRFPELFRRLAEPPVDLVLLPSAFLDVTGRDHWEVLVRARAIENQCYVIAANQFGQPAAGVPRSYGHSLIVDPWGSVLAQGDGQTEDVLVASLEIAELIETRTRLPALRHRRLR